MPNRRQRSESRMNSQRFITMIKLILNLIPTCWFFGFDNIFSISNHWTSFYNGHVKNHFQKFKTKEIPRNASERLQNVWTIEMRLLLRSNFEWWHNLKNSTISVFYVICFQLTTTTTATIECVKWGMKQMSIDCC